MIPVAFDYKKATSIDDALAALAAGGEDAKILGGGQSLLPVLRLRLNAPSFVVDCSSIDELKGVCEEDGKLVIGAGTTHYDVMNNDMVKQSVQLLAQATASVADPQIRHRGTVGGALAHADPRADQPPVALALDAEFRSRGPMVGAPLVHPTSSWVPSKQRLALMKFWSVLLFPRWMVGEPTTRSSTERLRPGASLVLLPPFAWMAERSPKLALD
jgi:FAD binding domain in molybdopterin dehydrogenase